MRKALLLMALVTFMATTASSQIKPTLYGGGGLSIPSSGGLSDFWLMGPNLGGSFGIKINPMFEITARFNYNSFPVDGPEFKRFIIDSLAQESGISFPPDIIDEIIDMTIMKGASMKLFEYGVDVRFFIPVRGDQTNVKPFLLVGAGSTQRSLEDVTFSFVDTSVTLPADTLIPKESGGSFCFGGGFNSMFSPSVGLYIEGRYNILMVDPKNYGWFQFRGGLIFQFGGGE